MFLSVLTPHAINFGNAKYCGLVNELQKAWETIIAYLSVVLGGNEYFLLYFDTYILHYAALRPLYY